MTRTTSKRIAVGAVVLSAVLSMNTNTSNAGIIGHDVRMTSGGRGIGLDGSSLVLTNLFSPALADFALRTGLIS